MNDKLNEARIKSATLYLDSRRRLGTEPLPTVNQYDNNAESLLQSALTTTKTRQQNQAEQVAQLEANSVAENTAPQAAEQAQLGYSGFTPDNEDALNMKREYRTGREYAGDFANAIASGGQRAYGSIVNTATIGAYGLRKIEEAFGGRGMVELQEALDHADEMTRVTATQNWLQQRKSEVSKDAAQELEAIRNDTSLSNSEQFAKTSEFYARNPTMAGIGIVESALGSFLEMAAVGGVGKAAGLSGTAAVNAGMFTSGANAYIQDVQADGTATDATLGYGAVAGAGTALLGIGAKKLIGGTDIDSLAVNGVNSGRAGVKNWARGTVQEATEETPQNSGQGVLKQLENNQPWDEGLGINAAEGLILGAGSGGMMSAPSAVRGVAAEGVNKANTKLAERDIKKYGSSEENLDPTNDKFNPARAYNNALYELKSSDPTIRAAASELLARSTSTTYEELAKIDAEIAETTNETTKKDLMAKRTKFVDTQLQPLKAAVENHINASTQNKENFLLILKQYGEDKRKREEEAQATTTDLTGLENEAQNNLNTQITERLKVVDTANYANELADFKGTDNSGSTVQIAANASEYTDLINSKAAQYGVPATLINAIVQTESEFNPNAKSSAGAVGLMQLMPGTAKDLKVSDRTNPEQNIDGGVRYIAQLLKRYDGNINNALMAYNWGMGHVDAYLKTGKGKNGKAIPNEAKQYAGKVKAAVNAINNGGQPANTTQNSGKPLEGKLQGTDARISEVVMQAAKNLGIKVGVSEGLRSVEAQKKNVANGKSQTMNSKHLHGGAVDFHIIGADGKANWDFEAYRPLAEEAKRIAAEKGYEGFEWGGDWNTLKDGVHFQFKKGSENLNSLVSESTEVQPQAQDDDDTSSSPTIMPTDDVVANETTNTSESAAQTQQEAASEETQVSDEVIDDGLIEVNNTVELTPEEAAFEEVAMNQTRAFFSSMSNEEVDNHPLLSPADKTALKELLAFESNLQNSKSVEEVRREIEEGSKGATNRDSNLGIQQYSDILRTAFASNDAKTASTYLDYLHRFANNSLSKSNAIAKANAEGATRENPIYLASNSDSTWVAVSPEEFAQANKEGRGTFAAIGENRGTKAIHEEAGMLTEAFEVYKKGGEALLQRPITLGNKDNNSTTSKTPITAPSGSVGQDTGNQPTGTNTSGFDAIERVDDGTDIPDDAAYVGRYKRDGKTFSMGNIKSEEDIGTPGWLGSEHNERIPAKGMEKYIESFKTNADKYEAFIDELISMKGKKLLASPKASRLSEVGFLAELMTQLPTDRKEAAKFIQRIESYSPSKGITLGEEIEEEVPNAPVRTRHDIDETKERSAVPASKKAKVKGKARQGITTTNARSELSTNSNEETDSYTNSYSGESSSGNKHTFTIKREKGTNIIQSITHSVNGKVKKNSVQVTDNTVSDELLMSKLEKSLKAENEFEQDNLNTKKDDDSNITEYEGKVLPKELVEKTVKVTEAMKIYADTLEQDSISDTERALFTALINTLINFNPDMKVLIGKGNTENSYDTKTNTIKINLPMSDGSVMQEIARMVISVTTSKVANELEQLGSTDLVVDLTKMYDLNADLTNLRNTIDRVIRANDGRYNHLDDDVKIKILEAMKSNSTLLEMATTDLDIMTFLQSIKANEQKVKQSIFTKIVNSLKSFLNVGNTGKVSNQFDKLLEITVRTASEQARNKQVSFTTSEDAKIHLFSGLDNTSLDILQAQEMQKNFYERNQLLAGFKQKSSKAKPLTSISDFTAKLKLDLMQGLQTLVSEAPTKAQREQVEDFLKFRDEIATHVKDTFRKKEGGKNPDTDYGYQDLKTYFMDDSGAINENVVTSVALAAYDWSIENGNKTMNMHKDLKKLLNLEVDDTVFIPPHIQEEYAYRGQLRPFVRAKLGKKAIDSLGIKANDTMSLEAQSRLENSMGEWVISAMQAADLIHINTMKSTDHFENIETVGGDLTGVDNINEAGQVSFVSITTPEGRDINPRLNEITTKNKGTINYLSKVFGMEIGLRAPFKKPPTDVMTKIKRTTAKMSLNQRRYVKKMQEEPISINKDMSDTLQNLLNSDRNITLEMIGAHVSESDLAKEHKNNRHSIQSAAEGVYRDLENGLDFVGSLNNINDNEYEPFYDAVYAAKNTRMHYNSNMFNFQSSKLQRSMGEYTNFKNDIDMTGIDGNDIAIYDSNGQISGAALFIRAVAESAEGTEDIMKAALKGSGIVDGFTVDKVDSELFVKPFFTYLSTDTDVQTAVAAINKSLKGKQLSKDEVQSIAKVVKFWEGDANSLRALVEFTKFQNSLNNGDSTFTTSLGLGSDGINNGSAISYSLFGVGNDKFFTQVGLLLKDGKYGGLANYFQTRTDRSIGDYYTGFEEHIYDAFGEQTDNQKMILELNTNFFKRKSFKAVLIPFGYSAGMPRLRALVFGQFLSDITSQFVALSQMDTNDKNYTYAKNLMEVNLSNLIGETITLPEGKDILEFWFTPQQENALRKIYDKEIGAGVVSALEAYASPFIVQRERNVKLQEAAYNTYALLKDVIIAKEKEKYIELLKHNSEYAELTDKQFESLYAAEGMPANYYKKHVQPKLDAIRPTVATPFNKDSTDWFDESDFDIPQESTTLKADKTSNSGTWKVNADGNLVGSNVSVAKAVRDEVSSGVMVNSAQVQGTDAMISARASAFGGNVNINVHDANISGLLNYVRMGLEQNKATFESLRDYHAQTHSLLAFSRSINSAKQLHKQGDITTEQLQDILIDSAISIYGEETIDTYLSENGLDKDVSDKDIREKFIEPFITGIMADTLATEYRKFEQLSNMGVIHQYGGEGAQYTVTAEDLKGIDNQKVELRKLFNDIQTNFAGLLANNNESNESEDTKEYPVRGDREIILTTNNKNVQPWMLQKDQDKSDEATRFLGFGYKNSSTDGYREAWGDLANIMGYTENDIVFVSSNGGTNAKYRVDPIKGSNGKPSPYIEHLHAIAEAGATIVMDDAKSRERPYNTGERAIMQYIKDELGYAEKTYGSGVWSPKAQGTGTPPKGKVSKEDVIARGWNKSPLKGVPNVEVSSEGDKRFSALFAVLKNGYSVEEMYQLFVKGYAETEAGKAYLKKRTGSIPGKRKAPIIDMTEEETYAGYKGMWRRYLNENPELLKEIQDIRASGAILTDGFATTLNNQARALAELASEMEAPNSDSDTGQAPSIFKSINDVANNFKNLIANPASSISEQRIKLFEYVMGRVKNHENNSNRVIKVAMVKDLNKNERGRFDVANNTIYINEDYVNATDTDGRMEVFLHETLHALTAVTIATNNTKEVKNAVRNLEQIRATLQHRAKQQGNNYLADVVFESVDEMVAYGMTDYDVQMFMRDNLRAKLPKSTSEYASVGRASNGLIGFLKSVFSLFKQKNDTFEVFLRSADTVTTGYTDAQLSEYTGRAYHSSTSSPVETLKNLSSLNVSTEHNEHLDTIIDTTIADFLGESAANETVVTDVISKVSTRAITAGFKMSDKELHVMEIVKVISQAYLKDNAGSVTAKEVRKAHERAMNEISVNTFLTDPSTATKAERKQAQRKYAYIFKQDKLNKVEQLERFFSLALTSEDFKNTLTTLDNVKKRVSEKGLFDRLVKAFVNMMTWLTAKTLNTDGLNMSRELDILYRKLADVNKSARNNEANLFDKTYSFTTSIVTIPANFAANKIIDALFKVFNFGSASRVLAVRNISSSMAGMRTTGVGSIVNTYLGLNTSATSVDGSNRLNGFGELLYELGRNTGMKGVVESIIRATNKAGQLRQSVVQATKSALAKEFTDFDKLQKSKLDSLTKVALRTDMSALLDNGVNVSRVVKLLRDSKERRAEIAKHEAFIATYANHNDILLQTKALGYYMATEVAPEHLVKNAEGIATGKDSWYEVDISLMDISLRNSIDQLASLYAVEATKKQDRDLLEQLITEQPEAIKAVLKHHLEMTQRSKDDFKDNMPNYVKGYMPQKTHELRSLKFAETEQEVKKLEAQGWEIITEDGIAQDTSDNSDARVLMFHNDMLYQDYVSGALDMKDTHAKGTMVYSVATDLSEVNRVKREKLRSRRERNATVHTNYNFAKQKGGNLIASYNASGELTGYHYEMSGRLRDTYLERDNNAIELLGIYNSNLAFKPEVIKTQQTLAQELHKDFVNSYANDPRQFVTLDPESKDPNVVAMWRMMPYAFRKEAESLFGKGKPIVVRNTIYNTVFGFRTYSMSDMFEKVNGERNTLENFIVSIMTAISGDKAQMRMLQGERLWQKGISQMKDFIVIRNYKVLIGNIVSNSLLLSLEGIPPSQQIKDFISVWRNGGMYRKLAARVLEIDSEIALNKGRAQVISRLNRERNVALNEMQNNPMHEFMEAGLMSSIVEDTNVYKEDSGYKSDLDKKIDKLTENIPEQVVTAFNWALMSPGTPMHNFMAHSTQFSDLAAKYSLIKHRMAKGDSQSKAIAAAQDAFINYDVPTGKGLDYMNKMGLFMFTKFIIRFQQAIARQLNKRAGSAVAQHLAVEELTNVSGVLEPFILNRFGNPLQAGLFNYGDAFENITTVHFVKSMF